MFGLSGKRLELLDTIKPKALSLVNGYILYDKNFDSLIQLQGLVNEIQTSRERLGLPPALIAVDYEGGSVQRFVSDQFTKIPTAQSIGQLYKQDPAKAKELIKSIALVCAAELGNAGINLCLGPSLDLNRNYSVRTTFRSYSDCPEEVTDLTSSFLMEFKKYGISAMGKHYPGFGACIFDTHSHFPIIENTWQEINDSHLIPFKQVIEQQLLQGIMLTHGAYIKIDVKPVPASSYWLQTILRQKLGFEGLIMTDCINMVAAKPLGENYTTRISNCLAAGCDIVLSSTTLNSFYKIINKLITDEKLYSFCFSEQRTLSSQRIHKLIQDYKGPDYYKNLMETSPYQEAKNQIKQFETKLKTIFVDTHVVQTIEQPRWISWIRKHLKFLIKPLKRNPMLWEFFSLFILWIFKFNQKLKKSS